MLEAPYVRSSLSGCIRLAAQPDTAPFYYLRDTRGFVVLIGDIVACCDDEFDDFQFGTFI